MEGCPTLVDRWKNGPVLLFNSCYMMLALCLLTQTNALRNHFTSDIALHQRHLLESRDAKCAGVLCSTHGECDDLTGMCLCYFGYTGLDCQIDVESCPNGQLNATGHCCESGVFDVRGNCCGEGSSEPGIWVLDGLGFCCNKPVDGCCECGGHGFQDAFGECCKHGMLDAAGLCCASGNLDECGVCDGFGESCTTKVKLTLDGSVESPERCLTNFLPTLISPENRDINISFDQNEAENGRGIVATLSGGMVKTNAFERHLNLTIHSNSNPCSIREFSRVSKMSTCGNGICEIGEAYGLGHDHLCPEDCPFSYTPCKSRSRQGSVGNESLPCSGNGFCFYAEEGRCKCLVGYSGPSCDQCADGYYPLHNLCHPRQSYFTNKTRREDTISTNNEETEDSQRDRVSLTNEEEDSQSDGDSDENRSHIDQKLVIFLSVFAAVGILFLLALVGFMKRNNKGQKEEVKEGNDPIVLQSSGSLLTIYLRNFRDFQRSPPWVGYIEEDDQTML